MKYLTRSILPVACLAGLFIFTACDWSSGSESNFNESSRTGASNLSGVYKGALASGKVVNTVSNIQSLVIQQSGNSVITTDSNGSIYKGTVTEGFNSNGSSSNTFSISFSGSDKVAHTEIEFTGIIEGSFSLTLKGTWIESNGRVSEVLATF